MDRSSCMAPLTDAAECFSVSPWRNRHMALSNGSNGLATRLCPLGYNDGVTNELVISFWLHHSLASLCKFARKTDEKC